MFQVIPICVSGEQLIRSVRPEARITINGKDYNVGGLYGQKEHAYFVNSWLKDPKPDDRDFFMRRTNGLRFRSPLTGKLLIGQPAEVYQLGNHLS